MMYFVAYDVEDDKVRNRLARFLASWGVRIQKSVFAVEVQRYAFRGFVRKVGLIAGKQNHVLIAPLCSGCRDRSIRLGPEIPMFHIV